MVAVRFAPSPTGYLHLGGARTAIFNWLFARKHQGKFFLRIEDTDQQRSGEEMVEAILHGLSWLGLDWDAEPIRQSARIEVYRKFADQLVQSGKAYRSFASGAELDTARQQAKAAGREFRYRDEFSRLSSDEETRLMAQGRPFAIRFDVPAGTTEFKDAVYGKINVDHATIDDFIILRSDGLPTYHLAVVVDDHEMGITHVIRGADHLSNTPKQIMLYEALDWHVPAFVHVPLILGPDKSRLSKRHGATSIGEYEKRGYLAEALFNFLALLGWSPGDDREILDREELISLFDIKGISKSNAVFDEKKLEWMNGEYVGRSGVEQLEPLVRREFSKAGFDAETLADQEYFRRVISLLKTRVKTIPDFVKFGSYFFRDPGEYEEKARRKHWQDPRTAERLGSLADELAGLSDFSAAAIENNLRRLAEKMEISAAKLIHPSRLAVTGFGVSPGIFETIALLGQERVVRRLRRAVEAWSQGA